MPTLHTRPISIIPSHLGQLISEIMMREHRYWLSRLDANAVVPTRVCIDRRDAEAVVCFPVLSKELGRCAEAVDQRAFASRAVGVGEEMESLETGGLGEVCVVGMRFEAFAGIGRVFGGQVGCEVVECACNSG